MTQATSSAQDTTLKPQKKIDVHAHFIPPFYREALIRAGQQNPDGMPYLPEWTAEQHLETMDRLGVSTSI